MEDFDFSPPETGFSHDSGTLNKHMEDFFSDVEPSIFKEEGKDSGSSDPISFGFGADYDIKPESRPGQTGSSHLFDGDGSDDEDRRFFETLANEFSQKNKGLQEPQNRQDGNLFNFDEVYEEEVKDEQEDQNEGLMDDTKATRLFQAYQKQLRNKNLEPQDDFDTYGVQDIIDNDEQQERDEAQEEQYDYFLDHIQEENANNAKGYHVIDEADLQDDDEDLEEIDDEERRERDLNMLKSLKEKIEKEEAGKK